jgi:hypothetical protein
MHYVKEKTHSILVRSGANHNIIAVLKEVGDKSILLRIVPDKGPPPRVDDIIGKYFNGFTEVRHAIRERMREIRSEVREDPRGIAEWIHVNPDEVVALMEKVSSEEEAHPGLKYDPENYSVHKGKNGSIILEVYPEKWSGEEIPDSITHVVDKGKWSWKAQREAL